MEKCVEIGSPEYLELCKVVNALPLQPLQPSPPLQPLQISIQEEIVKIKTDFTGYKDTDLLILQRLSDRDLSQICQVNRYVNNLCIQESF